MVRNRRLEEKTAGLVGIRHLQCLLLFIGLGVTFALRVNLAVAIVAMTDKKAANPDFEEFDWDEKIKSLLLGSFFWGYVVTQIPGGYLAQRFGAKFLLFFGLLVCSVLNILTPLCATIGGWKMVFATRLIQGICQGALFPSCHVLLSKWSPIEERGVLATFAYSGTPFGTVIMLATSGIIASSLGWPSIFYISGAAGLLWCIAWFFFGSSSPAQCRLVSIEERLHIENSLGKSQDHTGRQLSTPWLKILTSLPFWSLLIVHCAHNWGFWTLLMQIPNYMKNILGMDIKKNSLLSAIPYFVMCILGFVFCFIDKLLSQRGYITIATSRKLFNTIGHWTPMVALIALGYVTPNEIGLAVFLLTLAIGFNSAIHLGFQVNHIDLAPNFAGTLMGATNCVANFMGVLAPLTVGMIVSDEHDPDQWRIVFFIAAGVYLFGNSMFLIFGRTDVQPWNSPEPEKVENEFSRVRLQPVDEMNN